MIHGKCMYTPHVHPRRSVVANNYLPHKAPAIWNGFPQTIRKISTQSKFKLALKRLIHDVYKWYRPNAFGFWQTRLHLCYETLKRVSNFSFEFLQELERFGIKLHILRLPIFANFDL